MKNCCVPKLTNRFDVGFLSLPVHLFIVPIFIFIKYWYVFIQITTKVTRANDQRLAYRVNPLYNGIGYNSKTRYNINPIRTKIS